ncbi:MAG: putative toxin-antitoxin system toxin component, PIN family [Nitrospira sp. CG24C]|jgi:putative PIN family toxin of toxin-antitoxin system|nr:MAG: putative toxin-antitoxin system toxin component, PIN family [Nitrospira sp. CG24C]
MKVVFDTNVFISAFIVPGSKGEDALLLAHRHKVDLYSSVPILTETARILRTKFDQSEKDITAALKMIGRAATIVRPSRKVTVVEDLPDNRILECAVTAQADLIVTGDHHLLGLREFEGVSIVRLADFLRMIPLE